MFKLISTLIRGQAARAVEDIADRNALTILDQQIRDAGAALGEAKRALALAIAQDKSEETRLTGLGERITDLETRAAAALAGGREDLAREAAEAIARLEADRAAAAAARRTFAGEIERMRRSVIDTERRFADLDRGRRIAQAAEAVRRLRASRVGTVAREDSALRDAEATLARLRRNQAEALAADEAFDGLDAEAGPEAVSRKLEAEGFGPRVTPNAADVLERLKQRVAAQPAT
jgi:phage shock protein A